MVISDAIVQAIEEGSVEVVSILDSLGVKLQSGPSANGECRFYCLTNKENDASLFVNEKTGMFTCYSCHVSGSFLQLVASILADGTEKADSPDYEKAKEMLVGDSSVLSLKLRALKNALKQKHVEEEVKLVDYKKLFTDDYSTDVYTQLFLRYWSDRHGVKEETLQKFGIRDVFRGGYRCHSIISIDCGNRKSFEARMYLDEAEWKKMNPWSFSNYGYRKVRYPKGWEKERFLWRSGKTKGEVVALCEGVPSALRFYQLGIVGVSIFGSSPSVYQLFQVLDAKRLLLAFDNDDSGKKAVEIAKKELLSEKHNDIRVVKFPKSKTDPCDYSDEKLLDFVENSLRIRPNKTKLLQTFRKALKREKSANSETKREEKHNKKDKSSSRGNRNRRGCKRPV